MTHRRVRVRLNATDRAELKHSFAPCVTARGVFISSDRAPPVGTHLHVEIQLATGQPVLSGDGEVRAVRDTDRSCPGFALRMVWDPECAEVVDELTRVPSPDLHSDLKLDAVVAQQAPTPVEEDVTTMADDAASAEPPVVADVGPPAEDLSSLSEDLVMDEIPGVGSPQASLPDELLFEAPIEAASDVLESDDVLVQPVDDVELEDEPLSKRAEDPAEERLAFGSPAGPSSIDLKTPILLGEPIESDISLLVDEPAAKTADMAIAELDLEGFEDEDDDPFGPSATQIVLTRARNRSASVSTEYVGHDPNKNRRGEDQRLRRRDSHAVLGRIELVRPAEEPSANIDPWDTATDDLAAFSGLAAVDFGHTEVRVAVMDGRPVMCSGRTSPHTKSIAFVHPNGRVDVDDAAFRKLPYDPRRGIAGLTRLLGRSPTYPGLDALLAATPAELDRGDDGRLVLSVPEGKHSLEALASTVLDNARRAASRDRSAQLERCRLVGRASRSLSHRLAYRAAAEKAGWEVESYISSPICVAAAFALPRGLEEACFLVVDVGAGSTEAAVVEVEEGSLTLLAVAHDETMGGEVFDTQLADRLGREVEAVTGDLPSLDKGWLDLLEAAESAKVSLSKESSARVHVARAEGAPGMTFDIEEVISRAEAEAVFSTLIERITRIAQDAMTRAHRTPSQLDAILLAGGQTRSSQLREAMRPLADNLVDISERSTAVFGALLLDTAGYEAIEALPDDLAIRGPDGQVQTVMRMQSALPGSLSVSVNWTDEESRDWFVFEGQGTELMAYEPVVHIRLGSGDEAPAGQVLLQLTVGPEGSISGVARGDDGQVSMTVSRNIHEPTLIRHLSRASRLGGAPTPTMDIDKGILKRLRNRFR